LVLMESKTKKFLWFLILPLLLGLIIVIIINRKLQPDFLLHVDFLDVGQGDSIFIQTSDGNQIVIDGGPSDKVLSELGKEMPFFDRTIDLLILTHPDADHVSGFNYILKRYKVKQILQTGVMADTNADREFEKLVEEKHIPRIFAHEGQRVWLDRATVFDIYSPTAQERKATKDTNNTSIFGKLSFGKTKIMFTGDADSIIEDRATDQFNVDVDILKVGHHGSKYSSDLKFLQEVAPQYAVIEVGKDNTYGHPTQAALDNLATVGAQVLRTDQNHTIEFVSDGINLYKR
jgi:competence protein ComEC